MIPVLQPVSVQYQVAEGSPLPVVGQFQSTASIDGKSPDVTFPVIVTKVPNLNLLGRLAMMKLKLTNLTDHFRENLSCAESTATIEHVTTTGPENSLDAACIQLCGEFPTLFESTLGCLKDFSLDIRFKPEAKPIFKKPRPVPFSILQDLNEAYEAGIKRGVWELTDFNSYGTPVVPIRKSPLPGQAKASIRVCGDYSVTVNSQLEDHRQPIPLPEDLMRKLGRGYCFSKIDLANAYNQICLSPDSQKKLALSTHKGVLLQKRQASKHSNAEDSEVVSKVEHHYTLGDPCYALYFGPRRDRDPRWVPAIVTKVHGTRSVNVRVIPRGPTWRRHLDQLRPRYGSDQDDDPCEIPTSVLSTETLPAGTDHASSSSSMNQRNNPRLPTGDEYGRHNLRRSARAKRPPKKYCC